MEDNGASRLCAAERHHSFKQSIGKWGRLLSTNGGLFIYTLHGNFV